MRNRKFMTSLVLVTAASVIVGSGFSAWYFNENTTPVGITGSVNVTPYISDFGNPIIPSWAPSTFKVYFDQGGIGNTDPIEGIHVVNPNDTISKSDPYYQNSSDYYYNDMRKVTSLCVKYQFGDLSNLGPIRRIKVIVNLDIVYDKELFEYTSFDQVVGFNMRYVNYEIIGSKVHRYWSGTIDDAMHDQSYNYEPQIVNGLISSTSHGIDTYNQNDHFLKYKEGMKPTSIGEYQIMKDKIDGTSIQLNFSFEPIYIELGDGTILDFRG